MSTSVFSALFTRVSDPDATRDALEDFTTEALAGAIRRDVRPVLSALARTGCLDPLRVEGRPLTVFTQRSHTPPGDSIRLDLVLLWPSVPLEVWVEIKTGSPLSGSLERIVESAVVRRSQLGRYLDAQAWMSGEDGIERPPVVLLSEDDLRFSGNPAESMGPDGRGPNHLAWQDIVDVVRDTADPDSLWLELVAFLKEKGMTQDMAFPITAREATSLGDAHRLYTKSVDLVTEVNRRAIIQVPEMEWWGSGIAEFVRKQFRDKGRLMLGVWNGSKIGLFFGLDVGRADEAMYTIWMETDPKNGGIRPQAHALADGARLRDAGWELTFEGWPFIEARAHTVNYPTRDAAVAWFLERLADLQRAGLIALLKQHAPAGAAAQPAEDAG